MTTKNLSGKGKNWVSDIHEERPIVLGEGEAAIPPTTLSKAFDSAVARFADLPAMSQKKDGQWVHYTFREYGEKAHQVAKSLIHLGLKQFDGVAVMGFNSPEWFLAAIGGILAGGVVGGVYTTNGPDACHYQVEHSDSVVVFIENEAHAKKFLEVRNKLPKVKAYVQWSGTVPQEKDFYSWEQFMALGADVSDEVVQKAKDAQKPEQCCVLIYTSGTTGRPKAVMISHDNLTWTGAMVAKAYSFDSTDVCVSYLPLSHIAAIMTDMMSGITVGVHCYFAQPDALKGSLATTLKEVRPTAFLGVPRVWEKIMESMKAQGAKGGAIKQMIGSWAKGVGLTGTYAEQQHKDKPWGFAIADTLVFSQVKVALGLDRCKMMATAAAPIARETLDYFMSLYLPICEIYGMSESSGPGTLTLPLKAHRTGSTGKPMVGSEMTIFNPDAEGNGEICFRGRHVFMGYLKNDEATAETIDSDGWLHSGDVGKFDSENFLYITGRIKELLITAGGENIPPVLIENEIKAETDGLVSNVMLIGDKRKFLTCVVTLCCKPNKDAKAGEYQLSNELTDRAKEIIQNAGGKATTVEEALKDAAVQKYIEDCIKKANKRAISQAQNVQKFKLLNRDFAVETDELTPTLKLKRRIVLQNFANEIEELYKEEKKKKKNEKNLQKKK